MKYIDFKNRFADVPVINISSIEGAVKNSESLRDNVNKWVKKGYLIRLKNNLYIFNDNDRKTGVSGKFIANYIYTPSYVSLEYAVYYYGMIPETVYQVTSVTTQKTAEFKNRLGVFAYSNLNSRLFFGYKARKDENNMQVLVACPEKALLDFTYLRLCRRKGKKDAVGFARENRIQNLKLLNKKRFKEYLGKFPERNREELLAVYKKGEK